MRRESVREGVQSCAGAARCGGAARRASPSCCSTKPVAVRFMATWFGFGFGFGFGSGSGSGLGVMQMWPALRHSQMSSGVILKREIAMAVFCEVLGSTSVTISSRFLAGPDQG